MEKTIISEGKTTNDAIEKGLKKLKTSKEKVNIKVLENEEKRMFFNILSPRVVKVELTLKEKFEENEKNLKIPTELSEKDLEKVRENISTFLERLIKNFEDEIIYEIKNGERGVEVNIINKNLGYLIGYRGETLYAFQDILTAIAGKNIEKRVRITLDIEGYREKRKKTLEELAEKVAKTVIRTKKEIKLEPMKSYERKIIHSKLQENNKIETKSIGEEPRRRIVITLKK